MPGSCAARRPATGTADSAEPSRGRLPGGSSGTTYGVVAIRPVSPDEVGLLRDIRLRSVRDAPDAFGSSFERETAFSDDVWRSRIEGAAGGFDGVVFVAERQGRWIGVATARLGVEEPGQVSVFGLWVEPSARRAGVAVGLMNGLAEWARARGAEGLSLWVVASNTAAVALYRRLGFATTGRTQSLPRDPRLVELHMVRPISGPSEHAGPAGDSTS